MNAFKFTSVFFIKLFCFQLFYGANYRYVIQLEKVVVKSENFKDYNNYAYRFISYEY